MAETKQDYLARIHREAMAEFDRYYNAQRDERQQCLKDRRFYSISGAQWEDSLSRQFENKPKFEINKIHLAIIRIITDYRNNNISVNFFPTDGDDEDDMADVLAQLHRADERDSNAEEAYDSAFEEAASGGMSAWRYCAEYEDEDDDENEHQRIRIEPIPEADSCVFFSTDSRRQDKSDATRCFVLTAMTTDAYVDEFNEDPSDFNRDISESEFDWVDDDVIYVAEYFRVERKRCTVNIYENLDGSVVRYLEEDLESDPDLEIELLASGAELIRQKKTHRRRIRKFILSPTKVLEDCGYIPGKYIPVVACYGKRNMIDGIERSMGHVRLAKDAQKVKNMLFSQLALISANSPIEKPILTPEQVAGHENRWARDNVENYAYMLINPIEDAEGNIAPAPPIGYTKPPQIPPALAGLMQISEQDMNDLLGNQQAAEEIVSNISGVAVELIQQRLDMQTYIYISNMAKAKRHGARIWLSMAKELYIEHGRKMRGVDAGNKSTSLELRVAELGENKKTVIKNDLSKALFDVGISIGPSSDSRRQAVVRSLSNMLPLVKDPETQQVLGSMIMMNMEGEGIGDAREFFRSKLVRMGVIKPTESELKQMAEEAANSKPDPNAEYLQAAAQNEEAKAAKARADTIKTLAHAEESQAKTAEILSGISREDQKAAIEFAEAVGKVVSTPPPSNMGE